MAARSAEVTATYPSPLTKRMFPFSNYSSASDPVMMIPIGLFSLPEHNVVLKQQE
jgi:hypothetical protein